MNDRTSITTPIEAIVKDEISKIAYPIIIRITKVYDDGYVDVEGDYGLLRHIYSITEHEVGDKSLLVFANNNYSERIVI